MKPSSVPAGRLSHELREATAAHHRATEIALDIPSSIHTVSDYSVFLERLYRLYTPLEKTLACFTEWPRIGIVVSEPAHANRLACDLRALGVDPGVLPCAPDACLPRLPSFAHALGAMYVIEGSTLGSQWILKQLTGFSIEGADTFLRGHGPRTRDRWIDFCAALDRYGELPSASRAHVVEGAQSMFAAVGSWMCAGFRAQLRADPESVAVS